MTTGEWVLRIGSVLIAAAVMYLFSGVDDNKDRITVLEGHIETLEGRFERFRQDGLEYRAEFNRWLHQAATREATQCAAINKSLPPDERLTCPDGF